jgi:hypothetical protein
LGQIKQFLTALGNGNSITCYTLPKIKEFLFAIPKNRIFPNNLISNKASPICRPCLQAKKTARAYQFALSSLKANSLV